MSLDIVSIGEPMVEFNQTGADGGRTYLQGFGGDSSNFAIAAARQGAKTGYVTSLGADVYGHMFRELWRADLGYRLDTRLAQAPLLAALEGFEDPA